MSVFDLGIKDDLTGKRFGRLVVLKPHDRRNRAWRWVCKCDCGKETIGIGAKMKSGLKKSCGCYKTDAFKKFLASRKHGKQHPQWRGFGDISGSLWVTIRTSAKRRNLPFTLTIQEAWELYEKQHRKCALTGVPIFFSTDKQSRDRTHSASLDRIDSTKGYVNGNVQWVHSNVNYMKFRFSQDVFLNWCRLVVEYNKHNS